MTRHAIAAVAAVATASMAGAGIAFAGSASIAAADWSAAAPFAPDGGYVQNPAVASDAAGGSAIAWSDQLDGYDSTVLVAVRQPDGAFTAPIAVSTAGPGQNTNPSVAVGPDGSVAVLWSHDGAAAEIAYGSLSGGAFSTPQVIGDSADQTGPQYPFVSIDNGGGVFAAWAEGDVLDSATRAPGATAFGPTASFISPTGDLSYPAYAAAADGAAAVTFDGVVALRAPGGTFGSPQQVGSPDGDAQQDAVAVDDNGDTVVDWTTSSEADGGSGAALHAAYRPGGGQFGAPETVVTGDSLPGGIAMSPAGVATIAVDGSFTSPTFEGLAALTRQPDGTWSPQTVFDEGGNPDAPLSEDLYDPPSITEDAAGDQIIAWDGRVDSSDDPQSGIYAEVSNSAGSFPGTPTTLEQTSDPVTYAPALAPLPGGALAVWNIGSVGSFFDGHWAQTPAISDPGATTSSPSTPPPGTTRGSATVRRHVVTISGRARHALRVRVTLSLRGHVVARARARLRHGRYHARLWVRERRGLRGRATITIVRRHGRTVRHIRSVGL